MNDTLLDAVQQPNVPGALQQLMLARGIQQPVQQVLQQNLVGRENSPEQSQQLQQNRMSALQQYQQSLLSPVSEEVTPTEQGAYNWIGNMGKADPFAALTAGIGFGGRALADKFAGERVGRIAAAKVGYDDAQQLDNLDARDLTSLRSTVGREASKSASAQRGAAEKILPLYRGLFNSFSQQAKDMQFATPAERAEWIKANTDAATQSAVQQFGIQVPPDVLNSLFTDTAKSSVSSTEPAARSIEPTVRTQTASSEISTASPPAMKIAPGEQVKRDSEASRLRKGEITGDLPTWPVMPPEPGVNRAQFSQSPPPGTPPFRNIPNEKLVAKGAEGMGEGYAKDFTVMQDVASSARDQLEAYNALEKIDPNTGAFANAQGYIGVALQGMGIDPNTPLIQDAIKNRQANTIISQMSNAALRGEKGVQTRSDEVRIQNELAKTSDPKQAWNYLVQLGKERAQRRVDMFQFAVQVASQNNGVPIAARDKFLANIADDPLTQEFGGKLVFRTQFLDAFKRKYGDATDAEAVEYWKSLEQGWKSRRGGK